MNISIIKKFPILLNKWKKKIYGYYFYFLEPPHNVYDGTVGFELKINYISLLFHTTFFAHTSMNLSIFPGISPLLRSSQF